MVTQLESSQKRMKRAEQEKERLKGQVAAAKSLVAQRKQLSDLMMAQSDCWKQVIQSLESSLTSSQRQVSDLLLELSRSEDRLVELEQKQQELDQYLSDETPVLLLEELHVRDEDLGEEVKEMHFLKEQRELELARLRAEQMQVQVAGDNWSTKQTVGDESTGRVSDADAELELQYDFTQMDYALSDFLSLD